MKRNFCALVFFFAAVIGCASNVADPAKVYRGDYKSYLDILREWTRSEKLYYRFDTELILSATYCSKVYKDALRKEQARAEQWQPDEIAARERKDGEELRHAVRFLVSAYTPVQSWNNFADKSPSFRLWLEDAKGRRVPPEKIGKIKLSTRSELLYRPFVNEWTVNYEVLFPNRDESGNPLVLTGGSVFLVASGIQGAIRLEWRIP